MYNSADIMPQVLRTIAGILSKTEHELVETTYLPGLIGFDSLAIVHILESLETTLGIEADPKLLLPEAFETPRAVTELFLKSQVR